MQINTYLYICFLLDLFVLNLLCYNSAYSSSQVQDHPVLLLVLPRMHFFMNTERKCRWKIAAPLWGFFAYTGSEGLVTLLLAKR